MNLNPIGDCGISTLGSKEIHIDDLLTIKLRMEKENLIPPSFPMCSKKRQAEIQKKDEMYFNFHRFKYLIYIIFYDF